MRRQMLQRPHYILLPGQYAPAYTAGPMGQAVMRTAFESATGNIYNLPKTPQPIDRSCHLPAVTGVRRPCLSTGQPGADGRPFLHLIT